MGLTVEATRVLGIGDLHHFIFLDKAKVKRHVVFFTSIMKNKFGCCVGYIALTLKEYKNSKVSTEKLPPNIDKFKTGSAEVNGKTQSVYIINEGYLENIKLTNSVLKRAIERGKKLGPQIEGVFENNTQDFIITYSGHTREGYRRVLHINSESPKYSLVYYPENINIGLYDRSLNSRSAFPTVCVTLISDDRYEAILDYHTHGRRTMPKNPGVWNKIKQSFKNFFKI